MQNLKATIFVFMALLALVLSGCGSAPQASRTKVTLALGYVPNVQFAPFYVADDKGFFADEGIDIAFDNGISPDLIKAVGAGKFLFAISDADAVIAARAEQIPVVYVAGLFVRFPGAIISLPDSHISQPADMRGKRIGIPGAFGSSYVALLEVLHKAGLTVKDIDLQTIGFNQTPQLLAGKVDAVIGFGNNDALQVQAATGGKPDVQMMADLVPMVGQGLITNDDTMRDNPKLVQGMTRAMLRGMQYTMAHPDEAFQITTKFVPEASGQNAAVNQAVLAATLPLWKSAGTDAHGLGWTDPNAWQAMADTMVQAGIVKAAPPLDQVETNRFVSEAQPPVKS
jgi:NitT/TauT family transport system substrate-binding protein